MKQIFNFCGKYLNEKKGILTLYMLICIFGSMGGRSCHNCHRRMCICSGDILSLREAAGAAISVERAASRS